MNCCNKIQNRFEGKSLMDIPELNQKLELLSTDNKKWATTFKCKNCNQHWVEAFTARGHGEVPEVYKMKDNN